MASLASRTDFWDEWWHDLLLYQMIFILELIQNNDILGRVTSECVVWWEATLVNKSMRFLFKKPALSSVIF